ncbi:MAG TPA: MBL fold metallo-hydrolase [Cyclobacteriaceae bacterium]|jgi:L-ascorbate metabolism protein UlaG (beta-lactamase superfamily)|nr:MBL fold metallo-hydrolase [Cyclobacteriaceae bacterium]
MVLFIAVIALLTIYWFGLVQPKLGKNPSGKRLERIQKSSNYRNNSFHNLLPTEVLLKSASRTKMFKDFFLGKPANTKPSKAIPSVKTDLKNLSSEKPTIVWFGHSSYLIKSEGFRILVDPVMQGEASPVPLFAKPFDGADVYSINDLPPIDLVLLTHDHYDHLHYDSIKKLASTATQFVTSLGVGAHLEPWGVPTEKIIELDWWESTSVDKEVELTAVPARHFSGRSFVRGKTLWSAFVLKLHGHQLFLGGDSGYGDHFKEIGKRFGPFDIAVLECGQYGENWPYIHTLPEETVTAAQDLNAKVLMPVHWAKFELALHPWDEPIHRAIKFASTINQTVTTPLIGEPVILNFSYPSKKWWEG